MQKNDLILYDGIVHRVLASSDGKTLLINCEKPSMPIWVDAEQTSSCEIRALNNIPNYDSLSPQKKKLAHNRYTLIAPVLPFVADEHMRNLLVGKMAKKNNLSKQTIRRYLCLFLAYQTIAALVPRDCDDSENLSADEKNFRWAINKFFYSPLQHSLKNTYTLLLKERYTDDSGQLLDSYPPFHRFRYFYNKTKKLQNYYISREGLSAYQRNHRPLLGEGVRDFATSIGVGMLDSTILDIYLVNEEGKLVGRPILTTCIDAYSGLCCGYALGWEGGIYSLKCLLRNIISDKTALCKDHGIHIDKSQWDCDKLPATLVTDKGKEYTSYVFEQLTELGVSIVNLPPYRPDLKSYVEQFFHIIQSLYKPHLKGKGVIEDDYLERGAVDYRKTACLTIREFEVILLKCILYYNTQRVIESFPYTQDMIDSNVAPYANSIWNYASEQPGANLIDVTEEQLFLTLLPRVKATFTRKGLICKKLRYHADGFTEQYLNGGDGIVAFNPDDTSRIWLIDKGCYIPFDLIDRHYLNMTFEDAHQHSVQKSDYLRDFKINNLQAQISLIDDIQTIAARCGNRTSLSTENIRGTRNMEIRRKRSEA